MSNMCEHKPKKTLERKVINQEEWPCAYAATATTITYEIIHECKDCGERRTEAKGETNLD